MLLSCWLFTMNSSSPSNKASIYCCKKYINLNTVYRYVRDLDDLLRIFMVFNFAACSLQIATLAFHAALVSVNLQERYVSILLIAIRLYSTNIDL